MSKYRCWDNNNQIDDDAVVIDAMEIEHAAELFAAQAYREEGFDTCDVHVVDVDSQCEFVVHVVAEPAVTFRAITPAAVPSREASKRAAP